MNRTVASSVAIAIDLGATGSIPSHLHFTDVAAKRRQVELSHSSSATLATWAAAGKPRLARTNHVRYWYQNHRGTLHLGTDKGRGSNFNRSPGAFGFPPLFVLEPL